MQQLKNTNKNNNNPYFSNEKRIYLKLKYNNDSNIYITSSKKFYSLSESKVKEKSAFYFQNIIIDSNIMRKLMSFSLDRIDTLYFVDCNFQDLNILSTINYSKNLGFVRCGLYLEDIEYLLEWIKDWEYLETLDLSGNKLGMKEKEFFKWLNLNLWNRVHINNFILSENNFSEDFENRMDDHNNIYHSFEEIVF